MEMESESTGSRQILCINSRMNLIGWPGSLELKRVMKSFLLLLNVRLSNSQADGLLLFNHHLLTEKFIYVKFLQDEK